MPKQRRKLLVPSLLGASLLLAGAYPASAAEPAAVLADVVVMRPLGVAATAVGTGAFVATLPVTYISGTARKAVRELVVKPFRFTFHRPLGKFNPY